jgi:hypothetical protein
MSAVDSDAKCNTSRTLVINEKPDFPIPNRHCLQDFWGTKTA